MLLAAAFTRPALQVLQKIPCRATLVTQKPRGSRFIIPRQQHPRKVSRPSATPGSPRAGSSPPPLPPDTVSSALRDANSEDNNLLSPVHIPEDPDGILKERHPAAKILANSAVVIQRELEMMNIMLGFEQANKYVIMDPQGNHLGYMAEQESGMGNMMARQWFRTHRSFTTHVFDKQMTEVLRFHRPFSWISSRIRVYDPLQVSTSAYSTSTAIQETDAGSLSTNIDVTPQTSKLSLSEMRIIGEAQQSWAPLRRKYNLFVHRLSDLDDGSSSISKLLPQETSQTASRQLQVSPTTSQAPVGAYEQFAYVDEPFLSWDFSLLSSDSKLIGSVNRNFAGFGREIFTDTGVYALRMDAVGLAEESGHLISKTSQRNPSAYSGSNAGMSLDQRAVMLATAVSVDFDYFSRSRSGMGGFMPLWFGGEGAAAGEAAGGGVAGAGDVGTGAAGGVARGAAGGIGEGSTGAAAGIGTMAGYEAMQRGVYGDDAAPTSDYQGAGQAPPSQGPSGAEVPGEDIWEEDINPWGKDSGGSGGGGGESGGGGGGGGDGGGGFNIDEWF